ncbi:MAG TPA: acyl-CoA reductase [Bacteroidia bacterium]|nr:acyl-CoA reductase [Bacteroidia bacterium]
MEKRVQAFLRLRDFLSDFLDGRKNNVYKTKYGQLDELIKEAYSYNGWFTSEFVKKALHGITLLLEPNKLKEFVTEIKEPKMPKTVAVIMAGNIPAVGFHDFMCVLLSGNKILIKPSSDDKILITFFAEFLIEIESSLKDFILFTEGKLVSFDAVIATGSNNSALYFEKYFGKYPHIIRKNRTSVAVLTGNETTEELNLLGNDIFDYYGLGCRNVSKLYVPKGYNFNVFYESIFSFADVIQNKKYANNHEYNRAIYLLNQEKFLDNNFLIVRESSSLHSPIAVLFYEEYESIEDISEKLKVMEEELQCVVSNTELSIKTVSIGKSQAPAIFDFPDNINTLYFLNNLK